MRRMYSHKPLALPNETNKVYCEQFVADTLVINDFKQGTYIIKVLTNGESFSDVILDMNFAEATDFYKTTPLFYAYTTDEEFYLLFEFSERANALTVSIQGKGGAVGMPSDFHIDMFKVD